MKIAKVKLKDTYTTYDFKCTDDVKVNDVVVCHTARGLTLGTVVSLADKSTKATKWIVQVVNLEEHTKRLQVEERASQLNRALDAKIRKFEKTKLIDTLVESDDDAKRIIEELKSLGYYND